MKRGRGEVSVRGETYHRLKVISEVERRSIQDIVEPVIIKALDEAGAASEAVDRPRVGG